MKFHWMKIISLAAIAMVRGQNNEISFFDERGEGAGGTVPRSSKTSVFFQVQNTAKILPPKHIFLFL